MKQGSGARIYRSTPRNLAMLARKLQNGALVGVPTETVYGLAANALDPAACRRIFQAKGRPTTDPLIVHIHDHDQLSKIAFTNPVAEQLAKKYWPGPLTLVLPKKASVPGIVTAGLESVAVRMPSHPIMRRLLRKCGLPLAAPSANVFGYVSPTTADHVKSGLGHKISYILDGGPAEIGLESTIVDARNPAKIRVLRPGAITPTQLSRTIGMPVMEYRRNRAAASANQLAPGLLKQHYSPKARVILHKSLSNSFVAKLGSKEACLYFSKPKLVPNDQTCWLCEDNNQARAARQLFGRLRNFDRQGYEIIHAELAPAGPMAAAINDRLRRAAAQ
jgi:L-threonylcarbamoyladenylate synthase